MSQVHSFDTILVYFFGCKPLTKTAFKQQGCPQKQRAVIARRRTGGILTARRRCSLLNLKIRAAPAVCINKESASVGVTDTLRCA